MNKIDPIERLVGDSRATVVNVSATHCPHCRAAKPHLEELANQYESDVRYTTVLANAAPEVVDRLGIRGTPTVLAFRGTEEIARHVGRGSRDDLERVFLAARGDHTPARSRSIARAERYLRASVAVALIVAAGVTSTWWLAAIGVLFAIGAVYDRIGPLRRPSDPRTVKPTDAAALIDTPGAVLVDVRTKHEVAGGTVPDAVHIDVNSDRFDEEVRALDPAAHYVIYCESGVRSAKAMRRFDRLGVPESVHIGGGIKAWMAAGLPITGQPESESR